MARKPYKGTVITCKNCGCDFCLLVRPRHKKLFCSKACQSDYLRNNPHLPKKEHKFKTREQFIEAIHTVIYRENRYVTMDEIGRELHVCSSEFRRLGVDIAEENSVCGQKKPVSVTAVKVERALRKYIPDIKREVTFEDLVSPSGMVLRYDLGSEKEKLLVEVDGAMHKAGHSWNSEYRNLCDKMKDDYARINRYTLIRIPVKNTKYVTEEVILEYFSDFLGNQKPEAEGIPSNGSETDSASRPDAVCGGRRKARNTACPSKEGEGIVQPRSNADKADHLLYVPSSTSGTAVERTANPGNRGSLQGVPGSLL